VKSVRFVKMEGCGNDYVFLDGGVGSHAVDSASLPAPARLAPLIADRHRGVGGDGLILLEPGTAAPVRMRMWNADGSEGRLCLNGLRCAALYVSRESDAGTTFTVETAVGGRRVTVLCADGEGDVEIEAGRPDFRRDALPARGESDELWDERFYVGGMVLSGYGVSVGNPHLVLWMEEEEAVRRAPLAEIGEPFEKDPRFPEGVNVHLVSGNGRGLVMRSWERGSGATLACGSGAVGAFAVGRPHHARPRPGSVPRRLDSARP
jgi:diaminopimelate epimerase